MLKNVERARTRLRRIGDALVREAAQAAVSAAEAARAEAASLVPVETGRLRGSLAVRETENGAVVTTECPYASEVELGTSRRAATPFLMPGMGCGREEFLRAARRVGERIGKE